VSRRLPPLPVVPERFPPAFRSLLAALLARGPRLRSARSDAQRARRRALSQSGTFVGHRPYERGDDLRRIDWAAFARSGELFVKQLEEEERRTATLVCDLSASLLAGSPPRRLAALRVAAVIGGLSLRHLDGVTVIAPGAAAAAVATFAGAGDLDALLAHLDALPIVDAAPDAAIALLLQRGVPGRVHWVSDFAVPALFERPLAALRRRGAAVTGWLPSMPEDTQVPASGYVELRDPETGEVMALPIDTALAAAMRQQLELLARRQDRLFAQFGCPLVRWHVPVADAFRLGAWQELVGWCAR
jgi:uncharacterized protein (DUF58 family)